MKISISSDHGGFAAKTQIKEYLEDAGHEVKDCGTFSEDSCDYPDYAYLAAKAVQSGECERGVVICTTGVGISIAANKVKGIRCALCTDEFCAEFCRRHNDANMIAFGAKIVPIEKMKKLLDVFLSADFEGGRHLRRVNKITDIENE